MTRINYCREGDRHRLAVNGHAGQAPRGQDIVCAGISAISFALLGYLQQCEAEIREISGGGGSLTVDCTGGERVENAFDMALVGYLTIAKNYPQNVEVYIAANGG